jgi:poly(A) polymerase/tRNA nucleotidyltransferase (CCA-adding enzyme)
MEDKKDMLKNVPLYVLDVLKKIEKKGFEAYIVGGCVRDLLMAIYYKDSTELKNKINDWDITTNAKPDEILKIFPDSKYDNTFGTVLVKIKNNKNKTEHTVEVTTYRSEQGYSDRRHPDMIRFEKKLEKDLERRDFTVNAMAMSLNGEIVDLFGGEKDIKKRVIRAVGEPIDRFKEDALRMMRAIRFSSQLIFKIEPKTERAIMKMAGSIKFISNERIKDELIKILSSNKPYEGVMNLYSAKLLQYIIPELLQGEKCKQDRHHIYTVLKHNMLSLKNCPSSDWRVRMASWLHDIGKPKTKVIRKGIATFYNHEYVSAKMTEKIMKRLKFSNTDIEKVVNLIRYHMFYYNTNEVTAASVRRLIKKVGKENLEDIIKVRIADRLGSGTPKAKPYKLRHLEYMFERVQNDPVSVKKLNINGDYMIAEMKLKPGPKMGAILDVLLSEVIENPELNKLEYLKKRAYELDKLEVQELREQAKEVIEEKRKKDDKKLRKEFYVK